MRPIQKVMAGALLVFLLTSCTRDRPTPEVVVQPEPTVVTDNGNGAVRVEPVTPQTAAQPAIPSQATETESAPAVVPQPSIQEPTPVVVVPTTSTSEQSGTQTIQYTVRSGDTLSSIAEKYGVSTEVIRQLNYLPGDNLQANQVLRVPLLEGYTAEGKPTPTPEPLVHIVESGETLYGIAVQYGVDPTAIIAINNIADQNGIFIGQGLRIPGYATSPGTGAVQVDSAQQVIVIDQSNSDGTPAVVTSGTPVAANSVQVVHVVQPGEGLFEISVDYDVSADEIASANNIQNYELLRVGQRLFIPGVAADAAPIVANGRVHIVQAGEGLLQIAVDYGVSSESIAAANSIADYDLIYPGQQLIIPNE